MCGVSWRGWSRWAGSVGGGGADGRDVWLPETCAVLWPVTLMQRVVSAHPLNCPLPLFSYILMARTVP